MKNIDKKISIIVPVYKVEQYIRRCLDSILMQTYSNLEIILIDDGSPDLCGQICDEYAEKDDRIKVIHQKNAGLSAARNAGIEVATGEYFSFVDSDDFVYKDYCKVLLNIAEKNHASIAVCEHVRTTEDFLKPQDKKYSVIVRNKKEAMHHLICNENTNYVWGKIYKRELFQNIRFLSGRLYEDIAIMYQLMDQCDCVAYVDAPYYGYYDNLNSIIQKVDTKTLFQVLLAWYEQYQFCSKKYQELTKPCLKKMLHYYLLSYSYALSTNDDYLIKAYNLVREDRHKMFLAGNWKYKIKYILVMIFPGLFPFRNKMRKKISN